MSICAECGMLCWPNEYHPFAACLMFKGCHNGDTVRANLPAPAVEVTADAVEVRRVDAVSTGSRCRVMPFPEGNYVHYSDYAALVQQVERLTAGVSGLRKECDEVEQRLGRALGYPRYCDDQKVFPGATDAEGVCIGEHVAGTIAHEAANKIEKLRNDGARLDAMCIMLDSRDNVYHTGINLRTAIDAAITYGYGDAATAQAEQAEGGK